MPDFGHPFSGLAKERKISDQELIRSIRFMIAAEYEAIQLYMQLAESTDNKLAIEVLKDIADEERVHAGEFLIHPGGHCNSGAYDRHSTVQRLVCKS